MSESDILVNARVAELEVKLADSLNRLARSEGAIEQLNKSLASGNRLTNWQFIVFVIALVGSLLGSMYWATGVLERRFDERFSALQKQIDDQNKHVDDRFNQIEKRFDDLREVVLSQKK
jgi:type VI protein secretion system component VasK